MFKTNVPGWERAVRLLAGVLMIACGLAGPGLGGTMVGYVIACAGVVTALTGLVGYCPACAMAGRRLPQ